MIANVVQSGHVILETTTSSSSSSYLSSSPFSSLLMFVLFYSLKTATALTNSVFQFQLFLVFNYTNCTLKYARFNDSVRSDAALRIIAPEIHTSLCHIYPLMPTTDTGFLPYRHIVIESYICKELVIDLIFHEIYNHFFMI